MIKKQEMPIPYKLYRHFKGAYYCVLGISVDEQNPNSDPLVQYTPVRANSNSIVWSRRLSDFFADISDRKDNFTGQKLRFELVKDLNHTLQSFSTEALITELKKRQDSSFSEIDLEGFNKKVVSREYMLATVNSDSASSKFGEITPIKVVNSEKELEEFITNYPHRVLVGSKIYKNILIHDTDLEGKFFYPETGIFDLPE